MAMPASHRAVREMREDGLLPWHEIAVLEVPQQPSRAVGHEM
jgi:hypothetical protein